MLEKKRNQGKAEYQLKIGIVLWTCDPNDSISLAMKNLNKKPFNLWREKYDLSLHYTVEQKNEMEMRIFTNKNNPSTQRFVPYGERCNCSVPKQYLSQCHHKIAEHGAQFDINLFNRRNLFSKIPS